MYVIHSQLNGVTRLIAWTSDIENAKNKLEDYVYQYLNSIENGCKHVINGGKIIMDTKNDVNASVDNADNTPKPLYHATMVMGSANRVAGNFRQINITKKSVIEGWLSNSEQIDDIGYFAISQVNQTCNLYPTFNIESQEVLKELERERVIMSV